MSFSAIDSRSAFDSESWTEVRASCEGAKADAAAMDDARRTDFIIMVVGVGEFVVALLNLCRKLAGVSLLCCDRGSDAVMMNADLAPF